MGNEGHYQPLFPQGNAPEQPPQAYYGWQYEQEELREQAAPAAQPPTPAAGLTPPFPAGAAPMSPAQAPTPAPGQLPAMPAQAQFRSLRAFGMPSGPLASTSGPLSVPSGPLSAPSGPLAGSAGPLVGPAGPLMVPSGPLAAPGVSQGGMGQYWEYPSEPESYQAPVLDMGSSLGYGQGMEYQYFNAPQPSQALPRVRQTRLQQLRAERMRRQQGGQRDLTNTMQGGQEVEQGRQSAPPFSSLFRTPAIPPLASAEPSVPLTPTPFWAPAPSAAGEQPPVVGADIELKPTAPMAQRGPAGMLSLPSRPLPAVVPGGSQNSLLKRARQEQAATMPAQAPLARVTMILTGSFVVGRILGLLRTSLFAFVFGTSLTSDAYLQAFLVPDLIFNVIAGGALSSAFIPVFTQYMGERDERTAWHLASSAFNLVLALLCFLSLLVMILAPWLVPLYNPNLPPAELDLIVTLTRLMLLQSIIMGAGVIINSVLYARQSFLLPAIGTVLYNGGLILGLLPSFFLAFVGRSASYPTFAVYAATVGLILGAVLQVGIQIPGLLKERVRYTPAFDWKHPGMVQMVRQMLPRVLNAAMLYVSTFVDRALILLLAVGPLLAQQDNGGLITQYYQALQLMLLPLGIFGMAVSTAAFPSMAESAALGRLDRARALIEDTLRTILFLSLPCGIALIVLGLPMIQVLLQHGAFDLGSATATSVPLAFFGFGLAGLACVEILTRAFYAFRDSKTPVIVSVAQFVLKIVLSLILLQIARATEWGSSWNLGALALATSLAGLVEAAVFLYLLQKKIGALSLARLGNFAGRVLCASLAMGLIVYMLRMLLDLLLQTTTAPDLGFLGSILAVIKLVFELAVGVLVYIWATRQFGIEDFWKQEAVRRVLERFRLSWL